MGISWATSAATNSSGSSRRRRWGAGASGAAGWPVFLRSGAAPWRWPVSESDTDRDRSSAGREALERRALDHLPPPDLERAVPQGGELVRDGAAGALQGPIAVRADEVDRRVGAGHLVDLRGEVRGTGALHPVGVVDP